MKKTLSVGVQLLFIFSACIWSLPTYAQIINTIAGIGSNNFSGDGGQATAAELWYPASVALDTSGNLYIFDTQNQRIRKVGSSGIITTIAGSGPFGLTSGGYGGDGGPATSAILNYPGYGAIGDSGSIYFSDDGNNRIRKINVAGIITTIAGTGTPGYMGDGGLATAAQIYLPTGIVCDGIGNLYFADNHNNCIRKINAAGIITTIAGTGVLGFFGDGLPATTAQLNRPEGVALDVMGNLFIADVHNQRIRKVDTMGIITTIAGTGTFGFSGDGIPATTTKLYNPVDVVVDGIGNVYIGDDNNNRIRKINTSGIITTVAGTGAGTYGGDGGPATLAQLRAPDGIAVDAAGNLYIADVVNNRIRKVSSGNHIPSFMGGHSQTLPSCENATSVSIDTLLRTSDADTGQVVTWTLLSGPYHGTAAVAYTTTSTGGMLLPAGLSYTPAMGYAGIDLFKVRIDDGISIDTTTIHVTIANCTLGANIIAQIPDVISIFPNPNKGTFTIDLPSNNREETRIVITNPLGMQVQAFTIDKKTEIKLNVPAGIYFLSATTTNTRYVGKVIVE